MTLERTTAVSDTDGRSFENFGSFNKIAIVESCSGLPGHDVSTNTI